MKEPQCYHCKDTGLTPDRLSIGVEFCQCLFGDAQRRILEREILKMREERLRNPE